MGHFAKALARLDRERVRTAFVEANKRCERPVDPSNLSKYRNGQHPSESLVSEWIPSLSVMCEATESELWAAWTFDADAKASSSRRGVITANFDKLEPFEQREVLGELHDRLEGAFPSRRNFRLHIGLAPTEDPDWLRLSISSEWYGAIPENAFVAATGSSKELAAAYEEPACIHRELIPVEGVDFEEAYSRMSFHAPVLRYRNQNNDDVELEGVRLDGSAGKYGFKTPSLDHTQCYLFASFPYPASAHYYPVYLNRYSVEGTAHITVNLNRLDCRWLDIMPYAYHSKAKLHRYDPTYYEGVVTIGAEAGILPQGVGAVFLWQV